MDKRTQDDLADYLLNGQEVTLDQDTRLVVPKRENDKQSAGSSSQPLNEAKKKKLDPSSNLSNDKTHRVGEKAVNSCWQIKDFISYNAYIDFVSVACKIPPPL
jgi:hypothetical protein